MNELYLEHTFAIDIRGFEFPYVWTSVGLWNPFLVSKVWISQSCFKIRVFENENIQEGTGEISVDNSYFLPLWAKQVIHYRKLYTESPRS